MSSLKSLAQDYHVLVESDNLPQRRMRLLQALWREEQGYPIGEHNGRLLGSRLPMPYAEDTLNNYLTDTIKAIVRTEVMTPENRQGRLFGMPRIYNDLLSSQPLCFNLFGELRQDLPLATRVFRALTNDRVGEVIAIDFEHSPGRGDVRYTGDKSAFDVFVEFKTPQNGNGFIGIEVKYHENLKVKADNHRARYDEVANMMGCFVNDKRESLQRPPLQQIWRDHLLSGALRHIDQYEDGFFVFLYPQENTLCANAVQNYENCLSNSDTFEAWTFNDVVTNLRRFTQAKWVNVFYDRYMNFDKIEKLLV
ncbi:MAG: hypothetical protein RLP44_19830 [Aggregatilineales bacterium]